MKNTAEPQPASSHQEPEAKTSELTTYLHPDALYDAAYEKVTIDTSTYQTLSGPVKLLTKDAQSAEIEWGNRRFRAEAVASGTLRFRMLPGNDSSRESTTENLKLIKVDRNGELEVKAGNEQFEFTSGTLTLTLDFKNAQLRLGRSNGDILWATDMQGLLLGADASATELSESYLLRGDLPDDEHFFGLGGRIAPSDRRGQSVDIFSVKTGKVSGDYGGFPLPYYISTRGYGLFLNNPWPHVYFDFGHNDPKQWFIHAPGGDLDLFFFDGPGFDTIIKRFTDLTGRAPVMPRWTIGFWCSSLLFNQAEQALKDADRLRKEDYPMDVFVFDGPWRGGRDFGVAYQSKQEYPSNDMDWHPDFGDGPKMIRELDAKGIKTSLHINSRCYLPETAKAGIEKGLLRQQGDETVPRVSYPEADQYFKDMVRPRIEDGVALWWTDHSDRVSGEIRPGLPSRNLFGPLWNRLLTEEMEACGHPAHMSLSRGGGIGSQPYAIPWPGDTRCGLDALADDIWFMISGGLSGFPLTSADLGGFVQSGSPEDYPSPEAMNAEMFSDENLCRRVCHCLLFTPVPRIHNNATTQPKLPWNCSEKVQKLMREALHERYRFTPYLYSLFLAATETGEPLLRPLAYYHADDDQALAANLEFYLGECLLIAPVNKEGIESWEVYLPEGEWIHLWSGTSYDGRQSVRVDAPLYTLEGLPVFVKAGSILPRQPVTLSLGNEIPKQLELSIHPGRQSTGELTLKESPEIFSKFSYEHKEDAFTVRLNNPHSFKRQFEIKVPRSGLTTTVELEPKSSQSVSLK